MLWQHPSRLTAQHIEDTRIVNNAGYGISWRNNTTPQVLRNHILDHTSGGITLSGDAAGTIADNQFWGNTLMADGTSAAPITFTSLRGDAEGGDTDNDDGIYALAPGTWGRIHWRW